MFMHKKTAQLMRRWEGDLIASRLQKGINGTDSWLDETDKSFGPDLPSGTYCTKFGQLFFTQMIEIFATGCRRDFVAIMHQIWFGCRSASGKEGSIHGAWGAKGTNN